jgi:phosphate transport system substrate-binding protein
VRRFAAYTVLIALGACSCGGRLGGGRVLIQHKGSDTLLNVAQAWAEAYKDVASEVAVSVTGGGSGTGISAIINGTADIASASRKMKTEELEAARRNGSEPFEFIVGYDGIAVYVHNDNPLNSSTFEQLAEIYGEGGEIESWSQMGIEVHGCQSGEIVRVSRQNNSGTYVYFMEAVLGEGRDYKLGSRDMHGSKDVVNLVSKTPCAIGYSSLVFATPEVKAPCIARDGESPCVIPSRETAIDGSYPIARPLLLYTREKPEGAVKDYLDWILSDEGQRVARQRGYAPVRPVECP